MEDLIGIYLFCLDTENIRGAVNAVAPFVLDFRGFADCLAKVLHRPRMLDIPAPLLSPVLGPKLDLLLQGAPVVPRKLQQEGFKFYFPEVQSALEHELGVCPDTSLRRETVQNSRL
jgi:NAD dependent epimerase/dehydratase family enzyme